MYTMSNAGESLKFKPTLVIRHPFEFLPTEYRKDAIRVLERALFRYHKDIERTAGSGALHVVSDAEERTYTFSTIIRCPKAAARMVGMGWKVTKTTRAKMHIYLAERWLILYLT